MGYPRTDFSAEPSHFFIPPKFWHSQVSRLHRLVNTFCLSNRLFGRHFFRPLHRLVFCSFPLRQRCRPALFPLARLVVLIRIRNVFTKQKMYFEDMGTLHTSREAVSPMRSPQTHLIILVVSVYQVKSTESVIGFVGLSHPRKRSLVLVALCNLV